MRSRVLSPDFADAKCTIFRKNPLMRFFTLSLACALMRVERSKSNTGSPRKNLLAIRESRDSFFSGGQHQC
jgi:hypothetical protein